MPSGGHNRLPDAVKASRGTLQPSRINRDAPTPEPVSFLPCPKGLKRDGRACWAHVTSEMARLGYLSSAYQIELEELCWWYERLKGLRRKMTGSDDPDRNLSIRVVEASREVVARTAKLGLNPQDVSRIRAQKVERKDEELERLLGVTN